MKLIFYLLVIGFLSVVSGSQLEDPLEPHFGVVLVIDAHAISLSQPDVKNDEILVDASSNHDHPASPNRASSSPEHWKLLTSPSTFRHWLNLTGLPASDSRRFEYRVDPARFPDWSLANNSVLHWQLSHDSSLALSSRFLLDVFSQPRFSLSLDQLLGPSFDLRLIPSWAYFLLRRADLLSSEQSYKRVRAFMEQLPAHPNVAEIVAALWDQHGVWVGYQDQLDLERPYAIQPALAGLSAQEIAQRSAAEIAQVLYAQRYQDNLVATPRGDLRTYLSSLLQDLPQLLQADLWRALSVQQKFEAILQLVGKISNRLPPRFRHSAAQCWANPDLDGLLSSASLHFESNPVAARIFCWILTSSSTGLPQFIQDWLLVQDLSQFSPQ